MNTFCFIVGPAFCGVMLLLTFVFLWRFIRCVKNLELPSEGTPDRPGLTVLLFLIRPWNLPAFWLIGYPLWLVV